MTHPKDPVTDDASLSEDKDSLSFNNHPIPQEDIHHESITAQNESSESFVQQPLDTSDTPSEQSSEQSIVDRSTDENKAATEESLTLSEEQEALPKRKKTYTKDVKEYFSSEAFLNLSNSEKKQVMRKKEDTIVKKIVVIVIIALIVSMLIFGISFYRYWRSGLKPLNPQDDQLQQVHIPFQSSTKDIGSILEKDGIIKSGFVFSYYMKMNNLSNFHAGYYQMSPDMTLNEIAEMLQEGGSDEPIPIADHKMTIPEGYTIEQIGDLIEEETHYTKADFLALVNDPEFFDQLYVAYPELLSSVALSEDVRYKLEGYLFPATYNYYEDQSLADFVTKMVDKTNQVFIPYYELIQEREMTVQEVLTLASLVEKEGVSDKDRKKIAQVFYNRLAADMPLQSDISILYALNETKVIVTEKDTQIDSPYNLYIYRGFGPGPFNNPGEQAIKAVLQPDETLTALYFLADVETGEIYYADDYEEHLRLKKEHIDDKTSTSSQTGE